MPMYDRKCTKCGAVKNDCYEPMNDPKVHYCYAETPVAHGQVLVCHGVMERVLLPGKANGVIDDSIPGGMLIHHALCNPDGTPRRYDSHTEIRKEAERRGFTNYVRHVGSRGSDKSPHTSRWV